MKGDKEMSHDTNQSGEFQRGLKPRHVSMIAIGGVIGTGLFLGTGYTISQAGGIGAPLAYFLIGIIIYFLINSLGEMATYMPVSGSFQTYCDLFVSPALGFALGWNYWFSWAMTTCSEMVATAVIMKSFFPNVPSVIWCFSLAVVILALNLFSVKIYGEAEFWFASIKVFTIIAFIIVGVLLIMGILGDQGYIGLSNISAENGGGFPNGGIAVILVAFSAAFSYGGTEVIGITAGETQNPEKSIPKAVKSVFLRVIIFYVGSIAVLGLLVPYSEASAAESPYAMVFKMAGLPAAATFMNIIILTSLTSAANSGLYVCSRTLTSLAREGKAPELLGKINTKGVPVPALLITIAVGFIALLVNFFSPDKVYVWLMSIISLAIIFSWFGIAISHLKFRKWLVNHGGKVENLRFKAKLYPLGPILVMCTCVAIVIGQFFSEEGRLSAMLGVPLFIILILVGKYMQKKGRLIRPDINIDECNARLKNDNSQEMKS